MPDPGDLAMSCPEMVELLTEYLEDALAIQDRARFEHHLTLCPGCVTYFDQYRETITATGTLEEDDIAPEVMDELLAGFRDWKTARR